MKKIDILQVKTALNKTFATFKELTFELQKYHWFIKGKDFYTLHDLFETEYNYAFEIEDKIAEFYLKLDLIPLITQKEIAAFSPLKRIEEIENKNNNERIFKLFLGNLEKTLEVVKELNDVADDNDLNSLESLTDEIIEHIEDVIWKFKAYSF